MVSKINSVSYLFPVSTLIPTLCVVGLPLIYVGALTVPLGFARNESIRKNHTYDYGYEQACVIM